MTISKLIQKTETAIANGEFIVPIGKYRVYTRTTSQVHIDAGADYSLSWSYDTRTGAQSKVDEINAEGIETAVLITAEGDV